MSKTDKAACGRSPNGYTLIHSLIAMGLVLSLCGLCALRLQNQASLLMAQRQSTRDLSIYSQAAQMAANNSYLRRCSPQAAAETCRSVEIDGLTVTLEDFETFIEARYDLYGRTVRLRLYYDSSGLISSEYVS